MDSEYLHMMVNLLAVIFLLIVCIVMIKKFRFPKFTNNNQIKVINSYPIGSKERIILLEVKNKIILIGATANHVSTLHVFNEQEPFQEKFEKFAESHSQLSETV